MILKNLFISVGGGNNKLLTAFFSSCSLLNDQIGGGKEDNGNPQLLQIHIQLFDFQIRSYMTSYVLYHCKLIRNIFIKKYLVSNKNLARQNSMRRLLIPVYVIVYM